MSIEAKKVPVEAVRESVEKKTVKTILEHIKMFWFCSKNFRLNGKVSLLFKKILEHIKIFWFCFKGFRLNGKVPLLF
jgi:hypothetical protein